MENLTGKVHCHYVVMGAPNFSFFAIVWEQYSLEPQGVIISFEQRKVRKITLFLAGVFSLSFIITGSVLGVIKPN